MDTPQVDNDGFLVGAEDSPPKVAPIENTDASPAAPESEPPKRRRGRPAKNPNLTGEAVPPAGAAPKKTAKKTNMGTADVSAMAKQLMGLHTLAAMATGIPECRIEEREADMLATGIVAVCNEYDLSIDGKTGAALQLFAAAAMVYAPRVLSVQTRVKKAKAEAAARTVDNPDSYPGA